MIDRKKSTRINGRFVPGTSGNPSGRPKATPEEINLLARIKSLSEKAVNALESVLDDPNASTEAKLKAANIVIERQLGKPHQQVDQTIRDERPNPSDMEWPDLSDIRTTVIATSLARQAERTLVAPAESAAAHADAPAREFPVPACFQVGHGGAAGCRQDAEPRSESSAGHRDATENRHQEQEHRRRPDAAAATTGPDRLK